MVVCYRCGGAVGHEKRASLLHRTATTRHPCFGQDLGDSRGAGRVGLTRGKITTFLAYGNAIVVFLTFFQL